MTRPGVAGRAVSIAMLAALAACNGAERAPKAQPSPFPSPDRPVANVQSTYWITEDARDRLNEAEHVMDRSGIRPGMTVADIGAGKGYYTVRLAKRVGPEGRVLAEDIVPSVHDSLAQRVAHDRLDNVSVTLGEPADPKLPDASFDRIFMVNMYNEIARPYEFLWRMRPALRPSGQVIVVDADRPIEDHGTPAALLECEFAAVGYRLVRMEAMRSSHGYLAVFQRAGPRPDPGAIVPCRLADQARATKP